MRSTFPEVTEAVVVAAGCEAHRRTPARRRGAVVAQNSTGGGVDGFYSRSPLRWMHTHCSRERVR